MRLGSRFFHDTAFKQQLNVAVTTGVIFFALASSLLTSWQGSRQIRHTLLEQGEHIAENFAGQSKLALLYASADNAREAVKTALSFPDVTRVEIYLANGRSLMVSGNGAAAPNDNAPLPDNSIRHAYLETETGDAWRFIAPVLSPGEDSPFVMVEHKAEVLGFVRVVQSKATMTRMLVDIFLLNLAVSLLFAIAFLFVLRQLASRLTRPITALSKAMARAERGEADVHAEISGPKDIRDMATAFNRMIAALQEREQALRESEARFGLFMDTLPAAAFIKDQDSTTLYANRYMANTVLGGKEWLGKSTRELFAPEVAEKLIADEQRSLVDGYQVAEEEIRSADGQLRLYQAHTFSIPRQGQTPLLGGIALDITEHRAAAEKIEHLAFYDPLTDLPNRRLLLDRLQQALTSSARHHRHGALMLLDMDDFKTLNDTLGHDVGDRFLIEVAKRLQDCVRDGDTVARHGGDEFVVILEDLNEDTLAAMQAESVAVKIRRAINQPYLLDLTADGIHNTRSYHCTSSIGITLFRDTPISVEELMKRADTAMYRAKAAGRNTLRFFDPEMQAAVTARAALDNDLREAVREEQFLLYYQPQVDAAGRMTGAEALVRWRHPLRGMVSPAEFIPLAEETGLILPIGHWVLEAACAQLVVWAARPETAHLTVAVNVSARQFRHPDYVAQVLAALDGSGANPKRLKLELTESLLLDDVEDIITKMIDLKAKGVGFSLDDFGTGYSSLSYLKRLPLDQLKIDQSFVRNVLTDVNDAAIARTIVALANSMGLAVIAEGVETAAQREFLAANGCHAYQGYFFGRPVPAAELRCGASGLDAP